MATIRAPRVRIEVYGGSVAEGAYRAFTRRHPRIRITQSKRWGVALLRVPDSFEAYLTEHTSLRKRQRRAMKLGFRHAVVSPIEHVDEIVEVNRSMPTRQGRPMADHYVEREFVAQQVAATNSMHAVFDGSGRLRAYAVVKPIGDLSLVTQILGHGDDLERGIMFLLMSGIVQAAVETRQVTGSPAWLMYDTFWGATKGLAFFKTRAGFAPYTVDWAWVDRRAPDVAAVPDQGPSRT